MIGDMQVCVHTARGLPVRTQLIWIWERLRLLNISASSVFAARLADIVIRDVILIDLSTVTPLKLMRTFSCTNFSTLSHLLELLVQLALRAFRVCVYTWLIL